MLQELSASVRRWAGMPTNQKPDMPLVRVGDTPQDSLTLAHSDMSSLRGVTTSAADQAPCTCP
jgi:hypothetical protein